MRSILPFFLLGCDAERRDPSRDATVSLIHITEDYACATDAEADGMLAAAAPVETVVQVQAWACGSASVQSFTAACWQIPTTMLAPDSSSKPRFAYLPCSPGTETIRLEWLLLDDAE